MANYQRTIEELQNVAIRQWPRHILDKLSETSILQKLLDTQDYFISVLKISNLKPESWNDVLQQNDKLSKALFLKHLMVLSDIGGESLNKLSPLSRYLPNNELLFIWKGNTYKYKFKEIYDRCSLNNSNLHTDESSLLNGYNKFTDKMFDVVMLILYGGLAINGYLPSEIQDKCIIGDLIGKNKELNDFVKQNYIRVSRQVAGAISNSLGTITQNYVKDYLKNSLPDNFTIENNSKLPNVSHGNDDNETTFDIVVKSPNNNYCGIEVSFQVTTNSVIERKARESESLYQSVSNAGHKMAYVIDGAGNIDIRTKAVSTICSYSDCTVAFSDEELNILVDFILKNIL